MTDLQKQVAAKLAFEPGDKVIILEIWLTVWKTMCKAGITDNDKYIKAREVFDQAYLEHGIKGPLATTALAAVGL